LRGNAASVGSARLTACLLAGGSTLIRFLYDKRDVDAGPILRRRGLFAL
jgi:hypothetical protein